MTQELRKLAEAAPRFKEWYVLPATQPEDYEHSHVICMEDYGVLGYWKGHKSHHTDADWLLKKEDAEYIAAANPTAILALLDRLEKAEKDAERYRWFADIAVGGAFDKAEAAFACFEHSESCTKDELDAAIDAALEASK